MALNGFLKIEDPKIDGEARGDHADEIEFHGLNWLVEQKNKAAIGGGTTQSKAMVGSFEIFKWMDASSAYLALAAMNGTTIVKAILTLRKDSGPDAHLDYLQVTVEEGVISRYEMMAPSFAGETTDLQLVRERVAFAFEKITFKYVLHAEGGKAGAEHEVAYNIVEAA